MAGHKGNALVIGPGPVTPAQGPAFQYMAARGCRHLQRMGWRVFVLEDNPATLMPPGGMEADLFLEPPAVEVVRQIVEHCDIDSIWFGLGCRRGWLLAMRLAREDWYEACGVRAPGMDYRTLWQCGDRSLLRETLEASGMANPRFHAVGNMRDGQDAAERLGFPLVVRPHFSCGGWGSGLAYNLEDYSALLEEALREGLTGEVLVEEALYGWRKYIAVVLRDSSGRTCVPGVFEQEDPLPVHDEDAVLVYPPQRCGREGVYAIEEMARKVVEVLDLPGLVEVKLAADPRWEALYVIDVNPAPWRTTPLLESARKTDLLDIHLELVNGEPLSRKTMDLEVRPPECVTVVVPRLSFSVESGGEGYIALACASMGRHMHQGGDVGEAAARAAAGMTRAGDDAGLARVLDGLGGLMLLNERGMAPDIGLRQEISGDSEPSYCWSWPASGGLAEGLMFLACDNDGPSGGYEANVNCYQALKAWRDEGEAAAVYTPDPAFALFAAQEADAVFLGPLEVGAVTHAMSGAGLGRVTAQYGGRAAMDLAPGLAAVGMEVWGSQTAAGGSKLKTTLEKLAGAGLPVVDFHTSRGRDEGTEVLGKAAYPLLATVEEAGARAVQKLVYTAEEGKTFLALHAGDILWRGLREEAQEVQVEAVASHEGHIVLLWEQVDAAGIYSTDGLGVYPPRYLTSEQSSRALDLARRAIDVLGWRGNLSMRIHISNGDTILWSISPGPSANLPFLHRASSVPLAAAGMMALAGRKTEAVAADESCSAVRAPLIPFGLIADSDILPSPQRRSTGSVMGVANDPGMALAKALWSQGMRPQPGGKAFLSVANREKRRALLLARELQQAGYVLMATKGTAHALAAAGIEVETVNKLREGRPNILDLIHNGQVGLVVNVPRGKHPHSDGFYIRAASVRRGIPCITNMEVALALARGLRMADPPAWEVHPLDEYCRLRHEARSG